MDEQFISNVLRGKLGEQTIREVCVRGRSLMIRTRLDLRNVNQFNSEIATIHGVVVAADPAVDEVILDDASGKWIVIPMEAIRAHHRGQTTLDEFRGTWSVVDLY